MAASGSWSKNFPIKSINQKKGYFDWLNINKIVPTVFWLSAAKKLKTLVFNY